LRRISPNHQGMLLRMVAYVCLAAGIAFGCLPRAYSAPRQNNGTQSARAQKTETTQTDPWTGGQTVDPAALAKELSGPASARPTIVSVSPHALYLGGHIPGAIYEGPGMNPDAIEGLKRWAEHLPRSTNLVVYCGCCPLTHCPNLRPAFRALQSMGFTHLRALILPTNFYTDWYSKGYPTTKGN
jgi:thiosulfate/3-mercaptopyruvate sulfurtransferase